VRKDVERQVTPKGRARDVLVCLDLGSIASEREDHEEALRLLRWAKHLAPRLPVVREALGIALYRAERFDEALAELQAYRRIGGSRDQNHLIADSLRATGADVDEVVEVGLALVEDDAARPEPRIEAAIVVAAVLEESGQRARARRLLADLRPSVRAADPEAAARRHWAAAGLAERDGDAAGALTELDALLALGPDDDASAWRRRLAAAAG
jgi:tetratricopeptide (TPR) repeat protein